MRTLLTGASGLIGAALADSLARDGHSLVRLVRRRASGPAEIEWDPAAGRLEPRSLEGLDAAVHLAGESISKRWTASQKARIERSRVEGTTLLCRTIGALERKPAALVCASAVGYYGDRGDELLDETSPSGSGFLARVCRAWEEAAAPAREAGVRVVHARFGVVLSADGGALAKMIVPFRFGVGGRIGHGRQYMSWITLEDAVGAVRHALATEAVRGPMNAVAPNPVRNEELTRVLGRVLHRPTLLPLPAFAARAVLGEMAEELLLGSQRVRPGVLERTDFRHVHPELEPALRHLLG